MYINSSILLANEWDRTVLSVTGGGRQSLGYSFVESLYELRYMFYRTDVMRKTDREHKAVGEWGMMIYTKLSPGMESE
jgi:hypothetical protein